MNKGDKIICINTYEMWDENDFFYYKQGDIWQIKSLSNRKAMTDYPIEAIPISFEGETNRFSLIEMKNWITLAEWRDKQIDKILEDD